MTPTRSASPSARTSSGFRVPAVRADSIVPGDSLVERDGSLIEVASVETTVSDLGPKYDGVVLTFRSFGVCRIQPKTYRGDALVCVSRVAVAS